MKLDKTLSPATLLSAAGWLAKHLFFQAGGIRTSECYFRGSGQDLRAHGCLENMSSDITMNAKPVEWAVSQGYVPYEAAVAAMEERAEAIRAGAARELIWLLEHPALYTAGTSAQEHDLLTPERFPVYKTGRGGQYTYHGPGQRVAYVMLDITQRGRDVRRFVEDLENWIITALTAWNIEGGIRDGRVGVWVDRADKGAGVEDKIAAIGIRMRRWVSFHGISLNVAPDLSHFDGIVPCGISQHGVTSLQDLGHADPMCTVDAVLCRSFEAVFHRKTVQAAPPLQNEDHIHSATVGL